MLTRMSLAAALLLCAGGAQARQGTDKPATATPPAAEVKPQVVTTRHSGVYYDFATPFFAAEYALSRTGIPQDRVQFHYYHAGHMMYVRDEDRAKLTRDIRAFIRSR